MKRPRTNKQFVLSVKEGKIVKSSPYIHNTNNTKEQEFNMVWGIKVDTSAMPNYLR